MIQKSPPSSEDNEVRNNVQEVKTAKKPPSITGKVILSMELQLPFKDAKGLRH